MSATRALLPDGKRWHFQHGPIDLVIEAWGEVDECGRAYEQAWKRFETVLPELAAELRLLKSPLSLGERGLGARGSKNGVSDSNSVGAIASLDGQSPARGDSIGRDHKRISTTVFAGPHPRPLSPRERGDEFVLA